MNTEQLLRNAPLETLLVVFFNTEMDEKTGDFFVRSEYRQATSKYAQGLILPSTSYSDTAQRLTTKYHLDFKQINKTAIRADIINNLGFGLDDFLNKVYEAILPLISDCNYNLDYEIANAIFGLRGSPDFTYSFYVVDMLKQVKTKRYVDNYFKILLSTDELLSRLNCNFRELQPDYMRGVQRNTQIRINLKWYYENVAKKSILNQYKMDLMTRNILSLGDIRQYNGFEERLLTYRESVLGRELTEYEKTQIREGLKLAKHEAHLSPENVFEIRNQKIVSYARETFDDICVGCGHKYKPEDRTFKMPRNNRFYFEINHVIAYASNSHAVDVLDNLVKLCPSCHRALTPGRAFPDLQKEIIKNELESRPEVKHFVMSMMPKNYSSPVEFVYNNLK